MITEITVKPEWVESTPEGGEVCCACGEMPFLKLWILSMTMNGLQIANREACLCQSCHDLLPK